MRVTYDRSVDAAYIYLSGEDDPASAHGFTVACDPEEVKGLINLDFDVSGRLIGIEVWEASNKLPASLLTNVVPLGKR